MRRAALGALVSHWRRRPGQLATLILGLALATALWSGVQAINVEARAGYDRAADIARTAGLPALVAADGLALTITDFARLRRTGWPVTPVLEGRVRLGGTWVTLRGIDPFTHPLAARLTPTGDGPAGPWLGATEFLIAGPETAAALSGQPGLPPLVTRSDMMPRLVITDVAVAARLLPANAPISRLELTGEPPAPVPPRFALIPAPEDTDIRGLTQSFHLNLTAFGFLSFAVGLFILHGGIGLAFEERRPVFRTLRALGLPLADLVALAAAELAVIALLAALLGLGLGYLVAAALLPDVAATLRGLYGAPVSGGLTLRAEWVAGGLALALGGTAVAGAQSFWRLSRLPLLAAAMPRAWARADRRNAVRLAGLGAALVLAGLAIGAWGSGLIAGFALLGGLMLGTALILPLVLGLTVAALSRGARGPLAQWFWADTAQQVPGLRLALMALMLALAANIGVGTMVASFRQTFDGWLDQRLVSDLNITARSEAEAARLRVWLAPRVDAVLPIWHVDQVLFGRPAEIYGVADHRAYRERWPMLAAQPGVWKALHDDQSVLVSEQTARWFGLGLGDALALGPDWAPQVAGIYADYGNAQAQLILGLETLVSRFPDVSRLRHGVVIDPDRATDLRRALAQDFGLPAGAVTDRATIRAFSLGVFERTFTVTAALNVLTLGVAGLAILTSLLTLSAMRLPQLAPVWAVGLSRGHLARLELVRALALAGFTFAYALPVGLVLAWVLLTQINAQAFGWRLPLHLFPLDWVRLAGLAALAALASAAWPAWRLARLTPARLSQVFSVAR